MVNHQRQVNMTIASLNKMVVKKELSKEVFPENLLQVKQMLFDKCGFKFAQLVLDKESAAYSGCTFLLDTKVVLFRSAKITPTKSGLFVTLWKRLQKGPIQPFDDKDGIDMVIISVKEKEHFGHFVFPEKILIEKKIFSTHRKEGKRAMRVYPTWKVETSKQAIKTQKWQSLWFIDLSSIDDLDLAYLKNRYQKFS